MNLEKKKNLMATSLFEEEKPHLRQAAAFFY